MHSAAYKKGIPKLRKVIIRILTISTILFIAFKTFDIFGYKLIGKYTFVAITLTLLISILFYFTLIRNTKKKILIAILLTPLIVLSGFLLLFNRIENDFKLNGKYKLIVVSGGLMACGEHIYLTESKFLLFDKDVYHFSDICLRGISKIETIKFDKNQAEFMIYHNEEMDSENPYLHKIENKNYW